MANKTRAFVAFLFYARSFWLTFHSMLEKEFIPAKDQKSRYLLVMMHGLGDSIAGYRWMPEALGIPGLNYLLLNAPDSYYGGFSWYDFMGDITPGVARSRQLVTAVLDAQVEAGFPAAQTFLGGFSQGCLMAVEAGLRHPQKLAGIIGVSGYVCEPERLVRELPPAARHQRLLMTHGTLDPMIPIAMVREQIHLLKNAGLNLEWQEFRKDHTIAGEEEISVLREFILQGMTSAPTTSA